MAAWSRLQHNLSGLSLRVVFVTNSSGARLATGCPEGARVEIARDPGGHAASRYNARWRPAPISWTAQDASCMPNRTLPWILRRPWR